MRGFFSGQQIMACWRIHIMFIFTYFISGYLSKNLHTQRRHCSRKCCKQTQELSISDGLTGLYNQMHFFELLDLRDKKIAAP